MKTSSALFKALRPKQWIKNLLVYAALVFSENIFNVQMVIEATIAFAVFCVIASCGYLYNDLKDIEADSLHPTKKNRPLASGALAPGVAVGFMAVMGPLSLVTAWMLRPTFAIVALSYLVLTLTYTFVLKHIVIVDVMTIAAGFVLRAVAGAVAIDVPISPWFIVCTGFGALFLGLSKRRAELMLLEEEATSHRKNLEEYSDGLLQQMLDVAAASTLMSYALYTIGGGHGPWMMATIPFVVYGFFRYQYLVTRKGEGGAPTQTLLRDRPLQFDILLFVAVSVAALYLG